MRGRKVFGGDGLGRMGRKARRREAFFFDYLGNLIFGRKQKGRGGRVCKTISKNLSFGSKQFKSLQFYDFGFN
jgi:hypothetical protein